MKNLRRISVYTDKSPLLGPILWILSIQYFVVQIIVAGAWYPPYSWANNLISDLGNTECGQYSGRYVCSPQHTLMNASFVVLGLAMAIGSWLIYREFQKTTATQVGFTLMGFAGLGTVLVGLFPENTVSALHFLGALLGLAVGNIAIVVLAFGLRQSRSSFRVYSFISGLVSLVALLLFDFGVSFGLGHGTIERIVGYPQTIWLVLLGLYMTIVRVRTRRRH